MDKSDLIKELYRMKKDDIVDIAMKSVYTLEVLMRYLKTHNLNHIITDAVIEDMRNNMPQSDTYQKILEELIQSKQ